MKNAIPRMAVLAALVLTTVLTQLTAAAASPGIEVALTGTTAGAPTQATYAHVNRTGSRAAEPVYESSALIVTVAAVLEPCQRRKHQRKCVPLVPAGNVPNFVYFPRSGEQNIDLQV